MFENHEKEVILFAKIMMIILLCIAAILILYLFYLIMKKIIKAIQFNQIKKLYKTRRFIIENTTNQENVHEPMQHTQIPEACNQLKEFYHSNTLRPFYRRKEILYCLYRMVVDNKEQLAQAIRMDLHRDIDLSRVEVQSVIEEIEFLMNNMEECIGRKQEPSICVQLFGKSFVDYEPYGVVCVISPWNFPVNLSLIPTAGAIACGNTVFMKLSKYSIETSKMISSLIQKYVPSDFIKCEYQSGREAIQACCDAPFDYYFFTGSTGVGKIVHQAAAKKLVPVTLELGGKNPMIVDKKVNLKVAAKRIAWAKCVNGGQICVCCDHVFVPKELKEEFCQEVKKNFIEFFGENQMMHEQYPRMITKQATQKMKEIIEKSDVYYGGDVDIDTKYVQPTILQNVTIDDLVMQEEIFGPILPVIEYDTLDEVLEIIKRHPNPLACYVFTEDDQMFEYIVANVNSGSIYKNDSIIHLLNGKLPFGGNCHSGLGQYHGKHTFLTFARPRTVCKAHTTVDLQVRYWPFNGFKSWVINTVAEWVLPIFSYL